METYNLFCGKQERNKVQLHTKKISGTICTNLGGVVFNQIKRLTRKMNKQQLKTHVAKELGVNEEDLIWSSTCRNPLTNYNHPDGTIKGEQGYWVLKL